MIRRKTFLSCLLAVVLFPVLGWAADVRLAWQPNTEIDLAGYKIHYGTASGSYTASVDVGKVSAATISNLFEGTTYYFSASAYNTAALSSGYSNEVSYAVPVTLVAPQDSDGDGLSDELETNTYGTNPSAADSDGDGIPDGQEIALWESSWNGDIDGDGIINLLDWDADGDSFSDGEELSKGSAPGDKTAKPATLPMEAGEVAADHTWKRLSFTRPFFNPVVVIGGLSTNQSQASVVRLRNVTSSGFDIRIQEWECYDGVHGLETVGYLVIESGVHMLPGNVRVEAGKVNTVKGASFSAFTFKQAFPVAPVVMASVTTTNDQNAVAVRLDRVTSKGFRLCLQEQEANLQDHPAETVAYIAWQPSNGDFDGVVFEVDKTGREITNAFADILFTEPHAVAPVFLGQMQSAYGKDTAALRWRVKDSEGVEVKIAEETSRDSETSHTTEVVGYMAFSATPD